MVVEKEHVMDTLLFRIAAIMSLTGQQDGFSIGSNDQ